MSEINDFFNDFKNDMNNVIDAHLFAINNEFSSDIATLILKHIPISSLVISNEKIKKEEYNNRINKIKKIASITDYPEDEIKLFQNILSSTNKINFEFLKLFKSWDYIWELASEELSPSIEAARVFKNELYWLYLVGDYDGRTKKEAFAFLDEFKFTLDWEYMIEKNYVVCQYLDENLDKMLKSKKYTQNQLNFLQHISDIYNIYKNEEDEDDEDY